MGQQMRVFTLCCTVLLLVFSSLALAAEEVTHPYLGNPEYQNAINEIQTLRDDIEANRAEIEGLARRIDATDLNFFSNYFSFFSFIGVDISLLGLVISTLFIILYLRYIQKYNPPKWFILFKARHTFALVLGALRNISKSLLPMLVLTVCLLQAVPAWGDGLRDVQLSMSPDPLERALFQLSCGGKGQGSIDVGLDEVKGLPFHRRVRPGSHEHVYDVLVLRHALKAPYRQEDFKDLLSGCPKEELSKTYAFILSIDDTVMVRNIIQQRLMSLIMGSGRSDLDKISEIVQIYN
ncbi:MAG: hypothetical protein V1816_27100, partial [Pseudomonadota bacterium]